MFRAATTGKYEGHNQPVEVILARVKAGENAIPEIQRRFVWDAVKVRNLSDSPYPGVCHWIPHRLAERDGKGQGREPFHFRCPYTQET